MSFYIEKNKKYFTNVRYDLIKLLPVNPEAKVLEIGAGGGDTLIEIKKKNLAKEVVGIELMEMPESNQLHPLIDKFLISNIETGTLPFLDSYFDVILIGDVLEHLVNPWKTVERLSKYLKKGGVFIVSAPNIRFIKAFIKIFLKGDFAYEKQGLFDKTHLRFFCKKNIEQLFSTNCLRVESIIPIDKLWDDGKVYKKKVFNKITFGIFEEFLTLQYIVVAKKYAD